MDMSLFQTNGMMQLWQSDVHSMLIHVRHTDFIEGGRDYTSKKPISDLPVVWYSGFI